ncbi:MAG: thiosulfate oxidation carrier protein SoxY [Candidatus Puniceispirillum sp.]|nr:thiosulfate oxidation carrier protein SoxY [Candidatus Puniceispirillum sp.]MBL6774583.1 thiosulfate oxidation carrier protein SoxY [Candidatus Puniceispirillum sp.]
MHEISRRHALGLIVAAGSVVVTGVPALADGAAVAAKIKGLTGGKSVGEGAIELDLPEIAENGNAVKVAFSIDNPMTADNYVKTVHVMADGNPTPEVASFNFTPAMGACSASTRMRLAKTQNIIVLAEMSDGSFKQAQSIVKVTIGGCGG